jgi:hypothetical protein
MSDQDNLKEDEYERKLEASNEARDTAIEFHTENWMTAVTKSVEASNGTFDDVKDRTWKGFERIETVRHANSVDVFLNELDNKDFAQRAAQILIDISQGQYMFKETDELMEDMAASYAEFQYENNIKD